MNSENDLYERAAGRIAETKARDGKRWSYTVRWCWYQLAYGGLTCAAKWCARPRVGFASWCRWHVDRILVGETTEGWQ